MQRNQLSTTPLRPVIIHLHCTTWHTEHQHPRVSSQTGTAAVPRHSLSLLKPPGVHCWHKSCEVVIRKLGLYAMSLWLPFGLLRFASWPAGQPLYLFL
jgi:hypothetical protein